MCEGGSGGAQARLARGGAAGVGIMQDGEMAVAGEADIKLDTGGTGGEGEAEGREGVFRSTRRSAAMGDNFHRAIRKKFLDRINRMENKFTK